MQEVQRSYLPAAGYDWALPLYIGCGTGTLVVLIKRVCPEISIVGLDPDPKALARAKKKAARAGASIQFDQGFSDELPYSDASFDRVFSSFMFHHVGANEREKTLREVRRVLSSEGSVHLLDFESSGSGTQGVLARWLHSSHRLKRQLRIARSRTYERCRAYKPQKGRERGHPSRSFAICLLQRMTKRPLPQNKGADRRSGLTILRAQEYVHFGVFERH